MHSRRQAIKLVVEFHHNNHQISASCDEDWFGHLAWSTELAGDY